MLLGKRFFPDTGTPIWKIERSSVLFAVWLPEPFTGATWMLSRFTIGSPVALPAVLGAAEGSGMGKSLGEKERGAAPRRGPGFGPRDDSTDGGTGLGVCAEP